jgi:ATP-dependent helicase/nuclease subunit A
VGNTNTEESKAIKWTDEQAQVIDSRQGNLLVSAAAGSGKTAVLVERIIEMVLGVDSCGNTVENQEPFNVNELLVVTFTNAAAAQMKEKISVALQKKADEMMAGGDYDEHLIKQQTLINQADICTIDSFCLKVVKEYFSKASLDASFDIGDNAQMDVIKAQVMADVIEECYGDDTLVPGFKDFVKIFAKKDRDESVGEFVSQVVRVISSYPNPKEWLDMAKKAATVDFDGLSEKETEEKLLTLDLVKKYSVVAENNIRGALYLANKCDALAASDDKVEPYSLRTEKDVETLNHMVKYISNNPTDWLFEICNIYDKCIKGDKPAKDDDNKTIIYAFDSLGRAKNGADKKLKDEISDLHKIYVNNVKDTVNVIKDLRNIAGEIRLTGPVISTLIDLTKLYMDELMKVKRDKNLFEFYDIEQFAFDILCDRIEDGRAVPTEVGRAVAARYREILIDEYQDSNFLQEYILNSVSGHGEGINNVFMVGDVKQSIYKFRMARPDLFIGKYDSYKKLEKGEQPDPVIGGNCVLLTKNFRSEINVLKTVNAIFSQLMRKEIGGIEYDEAARLNSKYAVKKAEGAYVEPKEVYQGPKAEFIIVENNVERMDPNSKYTNVKVETSFIVHKIDEIVNGENPLYIGQGESRRKVTYKDIVILLRSVSSEALEFERAFKDADIPLYIESESGYFGATEISNLMSMLSIVDNSYIDYDMAAVLRSPLVGLSEEELAQIVGVYRERYEKEGTIYTARLYDKVLAYIEDAGKRNNDSEADRKEAQEQKNSDREISDAESNTEISDTERDTDESSAGVKNEVELQNKIYYNPETLGKLTSFVELLTYLKKNKNFMSISDIIRYVLDATGFYWFVGARDMGNRRQANVDMLIKTADDFEENSKGVFNFIRYVEQLRTCDLDFAEADTIGEGADVVRVMTMHKSKGLEFPVVFVSHLGKKFNESDKKKEIIVHPDYFIATDPVDIELRYKKKSAMKNMIKSLMDMESYAEEMRVLYVALTRAKEKLYITAAVDDKDEFINENEVYSKRGERLSINGVTDAKCFADWIYRALSCLDYDEYLEIHHVPSENYVEKAKDGFITIKSVERVSEEAGDEADVLDEAMINKVRTGMNFNYGHKSSGLKSKMSITEIKKMQAVGEELEADNVLKSAAYIERDEVPVPEFMSEEKQIQGNLLGTIYHKIMELIDFKAENLDIEKFVDGLFDRGLFDDGYRARISAEKIRAMLTSPLGIRMAKADENGQLYRERQFYMMMTPEEILAGREVVTAHTGQETQVAVSKRETADVTEVASQQATGFETDETVVVQGIVDAYFVENGEIVLLDYKTDRVSEGKELVRRYHVQLDMYARVLEKITGMRVKEKIIYSFCLGEIIEL